MKTRISELLLIFPTLATVGFLSTSCDNPQLVSQRTDPEVSSEEKTELSKPRESKEPAKTVTPAPESSPPASTPIERPATTASTSPDTPPAPAPAPANPGEEEIGPPLALNVFPFERNLTGKNGKVIEAEVIGRIDDNIVFRRKGADQEFNVPISSLAEEDRKYCLRLPKIRPMLLSKAALKRNDAYVKTRTKRLDELTAKKKEITRKMSRDSNKINLRSYRSELERIQDEVDQLHSEIDEYVERN